MQLVKLIGDEAMLVATDAGALVAAAVGLCERVEAEADMPPVRVGVAAGPALNRAGDWYGRTVNFASRLTEAAEPGTVIASETVVRIAASEHG